MMKLIYITLLATCLAGPAYTQILINEISYNPPESGNDSLEYIELYNAGIAAVNISGWHFSAGVIDTFPDLDLEPGGFFVTAISAQAMQHVFGISVHQWRSGALSNTGELIALADAGGNIVDSVRYAPSDPWPTTPNGRGPSLELKSPDLDNTDPANWKASEGATGIIINGNEVSGTPGAPNEGGSGPGPALTITLANFAFSPDVAVIRTGDVVRWVSQEIHPHNVNGSTDVYPGNPEGFFSGDPASGPWTFEHEFTLPGTYYYRCDVHHQAYGMTGVIYVYDPDIYNTFDLKTLRLTDANGVALFDNVPVTVSAVVHGINFQPSGYSFYIIDPENTGINIFSFTPGSYVVAEGDEVRVSGVLDQFSGLLEVVPDEIELLSAGNHWAGPNEIQAPSEEHEGSHIVIYPFQIDSIVQTGASGYNVFVTHENGHHPVLIRVDADTGFGPDDISGNAVRGIGSQFDSSFPFTDGYQILALEFLFVDAVTFLPQSSIRMYPNPADDRVVFDSDAGISAIEVYTLDGRLVLTKVVNSSSGASLDIAHLLPGLHVVKILTPDGVWISKLVIGE